MMQILKKRLIWMIAGIFTLDALFFGFIDPRKASSPLLIVGFIMLSLTIYMCWRGFLRLFYRAGLPFRSIATKTTSLMTLLTVVVIGLQSMGELTFRDLAAIIPLSLVAYFYLTYGRQNTARRQQT